MDKGLNILIVEDEYISGILLESLLSPYGRCRLVKDGLEGLAILRDSFQNGLLRFDLVLLDLELPGMSGHEILKEIRRLEQEENPIGTAMVKVVVVSSLDDSRNILEALAIGRCQAYLAKPPTARRIAELLEQFQLIEPSSGLIPPPDNREAVWNRVRNN